jgi:SAM-dependent methyltransferase
MKDTLSEQVRYHTRGAGYFWLTSHNEIVERALTRYLRGLDADSGGRPRILDLGCGPGWTLERLGHLGEAYGVEYSMAALGFARQRGLRGLVAGDGLTLPFASAAFDCVVAVEVLEHFEDDAALAREAWRVLRPGGILLVTVPAFMALWRHHDELYGHYRRYARRQLPALLGGAGFQVLRCEFIKCLFFLPLLLWARMNRPTVHSGAAARDDFFALPRWLNELLRLEIVWETRLRLNRLAPFGVSLLAVARRPGPERS